MLTSKKLWFLILFLEQIYSSWLPKIVWTFWEKPLQQENHFIKALHNNHIQKLGPGWEIRYFDQSKFAEWADRIPKLKQAYEHPIWKDFGYTQRIDLVKLAILGQEGGVYLDMTIIMTESLDWLLNMTDNQLIENKYGSEPELFYTYPKNSYRQKYFDEETQQNFLINPSMEMFFIASKANNSYLNDLLSFVVDTKIQAYFQYHNFEKASIFLDIAKQQELQLGSFTDKYFQIGIAGIILLAKKQQQLDKKWNFNPQTPRPLAVKDLKIRTIDSTKNAYVYFDFNEGFIKPFIRTDLKNFKIGNKLTPFVRFWDQIYYKLQSFLSSNFDNNCHQAFYMLQSSILYQYILKPYPIKFYKNPVYTEQTYGSLCTSQVKSELSLELKIQKIGEELQKIPLKFRQVEQKFTQFLDEEKKYREKGEIVLKEGKVEYAGIFDDITVQISKKQQILQNLNNPNNPLPPNQLLTLKSQLLSFQTNTKQQSLQYSLFQDSLQQALHPTSSPEPLKSQISQNLRKIDVYKNQNLFQVVILIVILIGICAMLGFVVYLFFTMQEKFGSTKKQESGKFQKWKDKGKGQGKSQGKGQGKCQGYENVGVEVENMGEGDA